MACLDMYNSEHKNHHRAPVSPRISFSSDFVDIQQSLKQERTLRESPPVSSDFEFSVTNYSMMSADELFSEGRLLPFKDNHRNQRTTLKQELLIEEDEEEDEEEDVYQRPSKGRWKGFLGLKKSTKKTAETVAEGKRPFRIHGSKASQGLQDEGGSSCKDVEIDFEREKFW